MRGAIRNLPAGMALLSATQGILLGSACFHSFENLAGGAGVGASDASPADGPTEFAVTDAADDPARDHDADGEEAGPGPPGFTDEDTPDRDAADPTFPVEDAGPFDAWRGDVSSGPASATDSASTEASAKPMDASAGDGGLITLITSFNSPGTTTEGITWDGSHVWVSDNSATLFELTPAGSLIDSFSAPEGTPQGITWDGTHLWLYTTNRGVIYELSVQAKMISQGGSFQAPTTVIGGGITNDLAWDGANIWYANQYKVYRLSTAGSILGSFSFPKNVSGIDWDGTHFWITYRGNSGKTIFSVVDTGGQVLASFPSPVDDVQAIAWGEGNHIWGFGYTASLVDTVIFELDAAPARGSIP